MTIRVLLLTQWFDPEPTFKGLAFARELVRRGFEVEVVTGYPNYPVGRLYPGYKLRLLRREIVDGVKIARVLLYPSHDRSAFRRVLNYASFGLSSFIYGLFAAGRADVIYAYHPPLSVGITASLIRMLRRRPVVYDIQDMWPDTLRATGMLNSKSALGMVSAVCNWVYRNVDRIVVLSPGFKSMLIERGVPGSKIDVIYNWADEQSLSVAAGTLPACFPGPERFKIVFAGNMGKAQHLDTVIDAAVLLQDSGSKVSFVLVGGGVDVGHLRERVQRLALRNVVFVPPVPMSEIGKFLGAADALLVHLRNDRLFEITIPSKIQAYMAIGRPLIVALRGDGADLVRSSGGGILAEPEDAKSIASAAEQLAGMSQSLLEEMAGNSRRYYGEHLAISHGTERFARLFERLAADRESE